MIKINPKLIFYTVLIILACFLSWCSGRDSVKQKPVPTFYKTTDTTTPKVDKRDSIVKALAVENEALKETAKYEKGRKLYYKGLYKSTYDSLFDLSDSIGKIRLSIANAIKQKQDSTSEAENNTNLEIIVNQFNQIDKLEANESDLKLQHIQDTTKITYLLNDSIPKVKEVAFKEGKKVGRVQGAVASFIAWLAIVVGVKVIAP